MNRRFFLSAAGCGFLSANSIAQPGFDCYVERLPGVQLFTVRDALSKDLDKALADLAMAGVEDVELYGLGPQPELFGRPVTEFKSLLDNYGLNISCTHIDADNLDIPAISANAHLLGIDTVILPVGPGFMSVTNGNLHIQGPQNREDMDKLAELLNSLGRRFRTEGFLFGYHNHHVEFIPVDGEIPYDYVMWNTDPQLVRCELDIGWLALAGMDYLDYLDRFGNRAVSCHLKDFDGRRPQDMGDFRAAATHLLPPGSGVVNFTAVLERLDYYGIRHGFVEIDMSQKPMADIALGQQHLARLRQC